MAITDPDTGEGVPLDPDLVLRYASEVKAWRDAECAHNRTDLRRGFNKGGGPVVRSQCLDCGLLIGPAVKRTPETDRLAEIDLAKHPAHESSRTAAMDTIKRRYIALQAKRWHGRSVGKSHYQRSHDEYLSSPEWAERRSLVMDRANGICEGCRKAAATEVHHLTYANWREEFLFELVALCGKCHDRVHRLDEDREGGCLDCVHGKHDGEWCSLFDMPISEAMAPGSACGTDREGFEASEQYG